MNPAPIVIVWFRQDLRLEDNPALVAAAHGEARVLPVFIWAPDEEGAWPPGAASRWWLHHSLVSLGEALRAAGNNLVVRRGPSQQALRELARAAGATAVFWNRRYEPAAIARDRRVEAALRASGIEVRTFNASLLHEPWTIRNKSGGPFQVFTPFWRTCLAAGEPPEPLPAPHRLAPPRIAPRSLPLGGLDLEPRIPWAEGIRAAWHPGSAGAVAEWERFLVDAFAAYPENRNRPDRAGTSRLSPHLHFGEISPRQVWHAVRRFAESRSIPEQSWRQGPFLAEVGWREFAHHLLYHFPHTPDSPLRTEFRGFPWRRHDVWLKAWERGRTGYPLVDAGMRQLWTTGWMHNRVRMVVASFLVKHLLISWVDGARWFWDTLVDADLASNTLGWQWTSGCGADAAPYFRVFNPVSQGLKFDPQGLYVRQWVPELAKVPDNWVHRPWEAPPAVLSEAGVVLGRTYPAPIVQHHIARAVALEAYQKHRAESSGT